MSIVLAEELELEATVAIGDFHAFTTPNTIPIPNVIARPIPNVTNLGRVVIIFMILVKILL